MIYLRCRYNYYADQYAYVDPDDVIASSIDGSTYQSEKLEDYGLMDMGLTYKFSVAPPTWNLDLMSITSILLI